MKTFYSQVFAKYSPFFPILMIVLLIYGYILRADIIPSAIMAQEQVNLFTRLGFETNFILENSKLFYTIEFWLSLISIVTGFFLGMSLIGKTSGLVIATFLAIYPYYVANTYSAQTVTIFFFILFLFFQLQATISYSKPFSAFAGIFFMLSLICNPICLILGIVTYIYQAIRSRNIAVFYNFLLFLGGAVFIYIINAIIVSDATALISSISSTFSEFGKNFAIFKSAPITYIENTIIPIFTERLAYPAVYNENLNRFSYWHYLAIFSSIFGLLYSLIEEKARILTILSAIILIQAFFMPINFGFLFLFVVMVGSYLIDKVFNDVFC